MGSIDLDAARAARAEAQGEPHTVVFGGQEYALPAEIPAEFGFLLVEGNLPEAISSVLGESAGEFWAQKPSINDLEVFSEDMARLYGFEDAGNLSPSVPFSPNGGKPSRATSRASTTSTSGKRAGGKKH